MDIEFVRQRIASLRAKKKVKSREMSLALLQSESYISHVESGQMVPSMDAFMNICKYFKITPLEFFDEGNTNPDLSAEFISEFRKLTEVEMENILQIIKDIRPCLKNQDKRIATEAR